MPLARLCSCLALAMFFNTLFIYPRTAQNILKVSGITRRKFSIAEQSPRHRSARSRESIRPHSSSVSPNLNNNNDQPLYIRTPLIHSMPLSQCTGIPVFLKLEALQPTGSFKDRGLSEYVKFLRDTKGAKRVISSSGGNAGHAAAWAGRLLGMEVTVVVPQSAPEFMVRKIESHGAKVIVHGASWKEADDLVQRMVGEDPEAEYITPYDHPVIWEGHKTMVGEIREDFLVSFPRITAGKSKVSSPSSELPSSSLVSEICSPGAIVCCVGGGGMLAGIYQGLMECGWDSRVLTAETLGAASFAKSVEVGERIKLDKIDTVAATLGAPQVAEGVMDRMTDYKGLTTAIGDVTDLEAVEACLRFAKDHRMLVEPSCGAALSLLYNKRHRYLLEELDSVVVIVCGGGAVDIDVLNNFHTKLTASGRKKGYN